MHWNTRWYLGKANNPDTGLHTTGWTIETRHCTGCVICMYTRWHNILPGDTPSEQVLFFLSPASGTKVCRSYRLWTRHTKRAGVYLLWDCITGILSQALEGSKSLSCHIHCASSSRAQCRHCFQQTWEQPSGQAAMSELNYCMLDSRCTSLQA